MSISKSFYKLNKDIIIKLYRKYSCGSTLEKEHSNYVGVVGLEVHAQINSKAKLFSPSPSSFGEPTNTSVSYFDAALPGTLPVLNKYCVEAGILTALACNCTVHSRSTFDRKHYFYPDLPAGYQITQQFHPLASNGRIKFVVPTKDAAYECQAFLKQLQLEQDSGRSFHIKGQKSFVDLNRSGIGLMELVFEPNLKNGPEAAALVKELICILRRIGSCTCEMEEGTLRVDANISVNKPGEPLGIRTEVKNINSLRFIAAAIDFEINRQIEILENGGTVHNETRAYDYTTKSTVFMRDKEMLQDYRFMPEPNLPPIEITDDLNEENENILCLTLIKKQLTLLPEQERKRLSDVYKVPMDVADKLVHSEGFMEIFELVAKQVDDYLYICDFLLKAVQSHLNAKKLSLKESGLLPSQVTELVQLILSKKVSEPTAFNILEMFINGDNRSAKKIVDTYNWHLISDEKELEKVCSELLATYAKLAKRYSRTRKRHQMSTLLRALCEKVNNRVSIEDSEAMLERLISKQNKQNKT